MITINIRLAKVDDYDKGFLQLLRQLTTVPPSDKAAFAQYLELALSSAIIVVAETPDGKLVGTAKLLFENKLHNGYALLGHIEDVVVDSKARGQGVGKLLVQHLVALASVKCYKICLATKPENAAFYQKCGFVERGLAMCIYTDLAGKKEAS